MLLPRVSVRSGKSGCTRSELGPNTDRVIHLLSALLTPDRAVETNNIHIHD